MDAPTPRRSARRPRAERARLLAELGEPIEAPGQMTYGSQAAAASHVFEQQRDLALRDHTRQQLAEIDAALRAARRRDVRDVHVVRQADRAGAARGDPVGGAVHRRARRERPRAPVTDASRRAGARLARDDPRAPRESRAAWRSGRRWCRSGAPSAATGSRPSRSSRSARSRSAAPTTRSRRSRPRTRARGLITYSSGNHAQGVARAARLLGRPGRRSSCRPTRPAIKRRRVEADGAEIVIVGHGQRRARGGRRGARGGARARLHPALRRRPDHRRPGHGRARDRRGRCRISPPCSSRSAAAGSRAASRSRSGRSHPARGSSAWSRSWPPTRGSRSRAGRIVAGPPTD